MDRGGPTSAGRRGSSSVFTPKPVAGFMAAGPATRWKKPKRLRPGHSQKRIFQTHPDRPDHRRRSLAWSFLETQFEDLLQKNPRKTKMLDILRQTWKKKMSPAGQGRRAEDPLPPITRWQLLKNILRVCRKQSAGQPADRQTRGGDVVA